MNILLVEPDYKSKFPPLGLLRLSSFHRELGDAVTLVRGRDKALREAIWHRIYVSSLFTYELPRTVETAKFYLPAVQRPCDLIVGGIGATLMPQYIRDRVPSCTVVEGPLNKPNMIGLESKPIADYVPDYSLLASVDWEYRPSDSYFCRITRGCIRKCSFCAVPVLERSFEYCGSLERQIQDVKSRYGEKQHLVLLDNNILAVGKARLQQVVSSIRDEGFGAGAIRNRRRRTVDFNQGIDARLVTPENARLLASLCLSPVRFAFDSDDMENEYRRAVTLMAEVGFSEFTNYVMFNFQDTPSSLYRRLRVNIELSTDLGIQVTGFPMRFLPINDTTRGYVSPGWRWRQLRGVQCILLATRGLVSPHPAFFYAAFGESPEQFAEIIAMPDRYIIWRNRFRDGAASDWRTLYRRLSPSDREEFLALLQILNKARNRRQIVAENRRFRALLNHYYPDSEDLETEDARE